MTEQSDAVSPLQVRALYESGLSYVSIGKLLNVKWTAVRWCVERQGVCPRTNGGKEAIAPAVAARLCKMKREGMSMKLISRKTGIEYSRVRRICRDV